MQLNSVWYRAGAPSIWSIPAYQDAGILIVADDAIEYIGKKKRLSIPISTIERVVFGRQGIDWVNTWVAIEHGDGDVTLFRDRGFLGWAGMLGGTKRIYDEIARAAAQRHVRIEMRQANQLSRAGYAVLFLTLIIYTVRFLRTSGRIYRSLSRLSNR
ncbi:MAG TPA: hypothetical protein VEW94_01700 [Chloroflexia bacterium]|nr:hypothetical protein [Chloroflexia bacterium]